VLVLRAVSPPLGALGARHASGKML
jgi:hypothetical protein